MRKYEIIKWLKAFNKINRMQKDWCEKVDVLDTDVERRNICISFEQLSNLPVKVKKAAIPYM